MEIRFFQDKPKVIATLAAKISQSSLSKSLDELYQESKKEEDFGYRIIEKYNHRIFGDFLNYAIVFEGISRLACIYIWRNVNSLNNVYGAGIETSFRVVRPEKFIFDDPLFFECKKLYDRAIEKGIKEQDARYVLPEATLTRLILSFPPRYFSKLLYALNDLDEFREIKGSLEKILKEEFGYDSLEALPTEWKFFGDWKREKEELSIDYRKIDGEIDKNSLSLNAYISGSLAMYAQLVRQRQNLCIIEPFSSIAENAEFVLPNSFDEEMKREYMALAKEMNKKQRELLKKYNPNFAYYLLLGQKADARFYGKGIGIIETCKHRSCGTAQWEIRNKIGLPLLKELIKIGLEKEATPLCYSAKKCIEPVTFKTKKSSCKIFNEYLANNKSFNSLSLDELFDYLSDPIKTFRVW
jgi:thymidylate synthase ThyX